MMSSTSRLILVLASTFIVSSCIVGNDDNSSPTTQPATDTPTPTMVAGSDSDSSSPTITVEATSTPSATQHQSTIFTSDDPDRQPDYPFPIPAECPVTQVVYGAVGENGRPGYWAEVAGVWAGWIPGPLYVGDNKVLWETLEANGIDLTGSLVDDAKGEFIYAIDVAANSPSTRPSILTFSKSGCWNIEVTTNDQRESMTVYVFPDQYRFRLLDFLAFNISEVEWGDRSADHQAIIVLHIQNTGAETENLMETFVEHMSLRLPSGEALQPAAWTIANAAAGTDFELGPAEEVDLRVSFNLPAEMAESDDGVYLLIEREGEEEIQIFLEHDRADQGP